MPAISIFVQIWKASDDSRPDRIQVNIPHKLQQIRILLTDDRLISILEKVSNPFMPAIKTDRISG
jgi:hypothetical protein